MVKGPRYFPKDLTAYFICPNVADWRVRLSPSDCSTSVTCQILIHGILIVYSVRQFLYSSTAEFIFQMANFIECFLISSLDWSFFCFFPRTFLTFSFLIFLYKLQNKLVKVQNILVILLNCVIHRLIYVELLAFPTWPSLPKTSESVSHSVVSKSLQPVSCI